MIKKLVFLNNKTSIMALFLLFLAQSAFSQPAPTDFTVNIFYDDGTETAVDVTANCTGNVAYVDNPIENADPNNPAVFTVLGDPASTCAAVASNTPYGYTVDETECSGVALGDSCTINLSLNTEYFTVHKEYLDGDTYGGYNMAVEVALTCTDGTVNESPLSSDPNPLNVPIPDPLNALPAVFKVTGFEGTPNCTAEEVTVAPGFSADNGNCQNVDLLPDAECTITNTLNTGEFTVYKAYSDGNTTPVFVKASCTGGGIFDTNPLPIDPNTPAVFDYSGFSGTPTCTAYEIGLPAAYAADLSDCQDNDALDGNCTITNNKLVHLDNVDRLGDAGIFQYYTVNGGWQTFIRVVNNSDQVVSVKLRFLEAANSREVLDFVVFLSPYDMWSGWTAPNAVGNGIPGVVTNDTSCLHPFPGSNLLEGFQVLPDSLYGAEFQTRAFTDNPSSPAQYDDGGNFDHTLLERISEGHIEIIGLAQHNPTSPFGRAVTHNGSGIPTSCSTASSLFSSVIEPGSGAVLPAGYFQGARGTDLDNVLAMNGYVINVNQGQGGGFDPDMLADFINCDTSEFPCGSLVSSTNMTATDPDLDSTAPGHHISQGAIKQKGIIGEMPVTGGVDAVSYEFQRKTVLQEWAASYNPQDLVKDYYTQWLLTFPTKHYYVDLQDDSQIYDDISPTLADRPGSDAYAPFDEEFDEGMAGESCEPFNLRMWNREERSVKYTSPAPLFRSELCYETNVLGFNDFYEDKGLNSAFSTTIPEGMLPTEADGITPSERGWAAIDFYADGGLNVGPMEFDRVIGGRVGLPITGWLFSIYNTNEIVTNHTTIQSHKYKRGYVNAGPPEIISDGGGDTASVSVLENQTFATDVEAIDTLDSEGFGLTYTLTGGADMSKFAIDPTFGILTFLVAPDFDIPGDADGDNVYDVQVTVTDSGPGDLLTDVQDIAVTVLPVNEYPDIVSNGGGLTAAPDPIFVGEIKLGVGTRQVTVVMATDPDVPVQDLTFSIMIGPDSPDADKFEFDTPTGPAPHSATLKFNFDQDFDDPQDIGGVPGDNKYVIRVKVTDNGVPALSDTQIITVEVTNKNENPVIDSPDSANYPENTAAGTPIMTVTATDPDTMPVQTLTFFNIGGADGGLFLIDANTGVLTFDTLSPDFEIPVDSDGDNRYEVLVMVKDDGIPSLNDTQLVTVTVTDVNENPLIISANTASTPENTTAVFLTVDATDVDADCGPPDVDCTGVQTLAFSIDNSGDGPKFEFVNPTGSSPWSAGLKFKVAPDFESPQDIGGVVGDNKYTLFVRVTDVGAPGPAPLDVTQFVVVTVTDVNEAPEITSVAAVPVAENTIFVINVTATDVDADCGAPDADCTGVQTLAFSVLPGKDGGKFHFPAPADTASPWSQQLQFITPPNFENPGDLDNNNIYVLDVLVTDVGAPGPAPLTDVQTITVTVTDVNETPVITSNGGGAFTSPVIIMRENTTYVTLVEATDEDADCGGQPATDSCAGLQKLVFSIIPGNDSALFEFQSPPDGASPWSQQLQFIAAPDFENDLGTHPDPNTYWLNVLVTDQGDPQADGLTDQQLVIVTVIDQNDFAPHIVAPAKTSSSPDIAEIELVEGAEFVTTVHAIDIDSPGQQLTYLKANGGVGGPDGAFFTLDPVTGELTFNAPAVIGADANGDSIYEVFVIARDGDVPAPHDSVPLAIFVKIIEVCSSATDTDGDRLPDCAETNDGVFHSVNQTGTDPNNADTDGDSIDDGDEVLGTVAGLDLPAMGLSPLRKNILLEYDWFDDALDCAAHSHQPTVAAIALVTAAFDAAPVSNPDGTTGITLIGDYGQGGAFTGGNLIVDNIGTVGVLATGVDGAEFLSYKSANFASNRDFYFHYVLMPHRYNETSGSSGQAELPGDDLVVSLQCTVGGNPAADQAVANTIMHELGHNLNLRHGGYENLNWKPNYNSVMNYKYQFPGIDSCADTDQVGDGILDYSVGDRIVLDENNLDENFDTCGNPNWDWNGNTVIETGVVLDINLDNDADPGDGYPDGVFEVLNDHDDWGNFAFTGLNDPDGDGADTPKSTLSTLSVHSKEIMSCENTPPSVR